jgi:hypothetical protein
MQSLTRRNDNGTRSGNEYPLRGRRWPLPSFQKDWLRPFQRGRDFEAVQRPIRQRLQELVLSFQSLKGRSEGHAAFRLA